MNSLKKLDSRWSMTLVICVTIVISSMATATAASLIDGKRIKKGTVTSKQIKNGTITKSDISKKVSVVGPTGPQGAPGAPGATNIVVRRVTEPNIGTGLGSEATADCQAGEKLTGGGAAWTNVAETDADTNSVISVSSPGSGNNPDGAGEPATGWTGAGKNTSGSDKTFVVYALCAKP